MPAVRTPETRAALALEKSPIPALRRLEVQENDSAIVIAGQLPTYYLKQLAQETVMPVLAGRRLLNRVQVVRDPDEIPA